MSDVLIPAAMNEVIDVTRIPEIEFQTADAIRRYQETRLAELLRYVRDFSPYYRDILAKNRIDIEKIKTIDDLRNIPFTDKADLHARNDDFICAERGKIIDYVTTSGTMGDPVTFALTDSDLERLAYNEYISFLCADGSPSDVYQMMCTLDRRFMAGFAYTLGIRKMGAGIIRVGNGLPELQWDTINRIKPNALVAVPSFILKLIEYAERNGIDYRASSVEKAVCIGENLRNDDFSYNSLGARITEKWDIKLYSTYASTEKATSFTECGCGRGGHHHPELIIIEVLDSHGRQVAPGEPGELVFTTLGVEGMPLVRYRSGDICRYHDEPCACGRNTVRLGPIAGRKNHMIKYKGTTLFPPALYDTLDEIDEIVGYYVEVYTSEIGTDEILIHVSSENPSDKLEKKIKDKFRSKIRVAPLVVFEEFDTLRKVVHPESSRKAVKFIDKRIPKI
jgi:phenylacetate-CoA ligase